MKAISLEGFGGPEVLTAAELPDPELGAGEVLIDVVAAGVNRADILQRRGFYPPPEGVSEVPGLEVSGRIAALGEGVGDWSVGQEVCALVAGGGYAERVAVPQGQVLPVPSGVDLVTAAALPEVCATVWNNLVDVGRLAASETVLIHGGAGGIGTMAVQIATALGARVAVTAGSAAKLAICRDLGAQILIDYHRADFVEALAEATDGHGADVILDPIGAKYLGRNVEALARGGRLVIIGMQGGTEGALDIGALLNRRGSIMATSLRSLPLDQKAEVISQVRERVWPMIEAGQVRPIVHRTFPLAAAAEAHRELDAGSHVGKVLLVV